MKLTLTNKIIIGFVLGLLLGEILYISLSPEIAQSIASKVQILSKVFLRMIKMIVGPLVFCTLVVGISKLGDFKSVGRIGLKTLGYFYFATILSLVTGLVVVNITKPGSLQSWPKPDAGTQTGIDASKTKTLEDFIIHIFPDSFFRSLAENEILQIVIFSLFFGVALGSVGEVGKKLTHVFENISEVIFKMVNYVMELAPYAVFAAMTTVVSNKGLSILISYGYLMLCFFGGLTFFTVVVLWLICIFNKINYWALLRELKDALMLSFSTASSEASFPQTIAALEKFGCSKRIVGFVLPLGYSFNLDGSMLYMTFATGFIAQAYGIQLSLEQQITMLLTLMITSKGIAGVPRASLVIIAGTLTMFNLPAEGIALLLGVDPFLDMGRTITSVAGNGVATCVVSKWEGEFTPQT
jgi:Na+/H+-dicarboxylate symporter